jgi:hypothetical protein
VYSLEKHRYIHEISPSIFRLVEQLLHEDSDRYLYRGQNGIYGPGGDFKRQIPSVYRNIRRTRDTTAALRRSHLQTAWLFDHLRDDRRSTVQNRDHRIALESCAAGMGGNFERPQYPIAVLGIAQHYGIATECLDLTNLEPAAIFATQRWLPIRMGAALPSGAIAQLSPDAKFGFIYRYDVRKLLEHNLAAGDLSLGFAGARPVQQEAKALTLDFNQDKQLFNNGVYEIFPFLQTSPFTYKRPIVPSKLLSEELREGLLSVDSYLTQSHELSMREFIIPPFNFVPNVFNRQTWQVSFGPRPDAHLILGTLIEEVLPTVKNFRSYRDYAQTLFGEFYGRGLQNHPLQQAFLRWSRRAL